MSFGLHAYNSTSRKTRSLVRKELVVWVNSLLIAR